MSLRTSQVHYPVRECYRTNGIISKDRRILLYILLHNPMTKAFLVYLIDQKKKLTRKQIESNHALKHLEKQPTASF